jgi:hypothetical protein
VDATSFANNSPVPETIAGSNNQKKAIISFPIKRQLNKVFKYDEIFSNPLEILTLLGFLTLMRREFDRIGWFSRFFFEFTTKNRLGEERKNQLPQSEVEKFS